MEAQHNQAHYEVKLREDQVKVDSAQRIADDLQAEYVVREHRFACNRPCGSTHRHWKGLDCQGGRVL
jgi:hypothetical protein